jgi:hypothetical protein
MSDIRTIARALGGNVIARDTVAAPGPGHSRKDRSLNCQARQQRTRRLHRAQPYR